MISSDLGCVLKIWVKRGRLSHGILNYFGLVENYLLGEGNLKKVV